MNGGGGGGSDTPRPPLFRRPYMLMMIFCLHLKNRKKNKCIRNKFDLEKLKNLETNKLFEKKINEKLTEQKLTVIENTEKMLQKLNRTMIYTATEILGKHCEKKNG